MKEIVTEFGRSYFSYVEADGAQLFTVVCLPPEGEKFPTVIGRSPYVDLSEKMSEDEICREKLREWRPWLENGYAVVFQHCRGCGKSSGDCVPYIFEREDGLLLQEWIRRQPFYNGELYLHGASYTASVHMVTAPFAADIKGAVLKVKDSERYNCNYRGGFYKMGLHGEWYVKMYKKKSIREKNYTPESFNMLPLSDFSRTVFRENSADFDEILRHPRKEDPFWQTRFGGGEEHDALRHANIPILLVTGFYDIFTGGVFDMWNTLDAETKAISALAVHPYEHGGTGNGEPIRFENGRLEEAFGNFALRWMNAVRGKEAFPFARGKVTFYKVFGDKWECGGFPESERKAVFTLGEGEVRYLYDPKNPASFKGGLSANFGGNAWQDPPHLRDDIITLYTPEFSEDTYVRGKMRAKLRVKSSCEDTCFYIRLSLCLPEGDYGLRDDITQISNVCEDYVPGEEAELSFAFDEHAFVVHRGQRLRIDISSSAFPLYVRHTNRRGLFSEQTGTDIAENTVMLSHSQLELPIAD